MIAGVDEAGRGPVLGPLVVAGVMADKPSTVKRLGAADSKSLSPEEREEVAARLRAAVRCEVRVLPAEELNRRMGTATLNEIEVDAFAEVLRALAPDRAVVDACDTDAKRFGARVASRLSSPIPVLAKHRADATNPLVGAASIVAKVTRDALVKDIEREVGMPVGSGYPSDPATRAFLERWKEERGGLPPHTRVHWSTVAEGRPLDRRLGEFPPAAQGPEAPSPRRV